MIESLSLLGVKNLPDNAFGVISETKIRYVDLSPTTLGLDVHKNVFDEKRIENIQAELLNSGITLNAVQGIFFGLKPSDSDFKERTLKRMISLSEILKFLQCDTVYIGAPDLRREDSWKELLSTILNLFQEMNINPVVENICLSNCDRIVENHYLGVEVIQPGNYCVDVANFEECRELQSVFNQMFESARHVHLSGTKHRWPESPDAAFWKWKTMAKVDSKRITYEFLGYDFRDLIKGMANIAR
jgi:hypothetical protein